MVAKERLPCFLLYALVKSNYNVIINSLSFSHMELFHPALLWLQLTLDNCEVILKNIVT